MQSYLLVKFQQWYVKSHTVFYKFRVTEAHNAVPQPQIFDLFGVTTRCVNCPAREAAVMFARSAIWAGTRFSRCRGDREGSSLQKSSVSRSKSDNEAHTFHLGTTTRCPPRYLPAAQSAQIRAKRLKLSNLGSLEPDNSDTFVLSPHHTTMENPSQFHLSDSLERNFYH